MSFAQRALNVTVTLGQGTFGDTAGPVRKLTGLRVSCHVRVAGGETSGQADIRIYGLQLAVINQLTTLGPVGVAIQGKNNILVEALDDNGQPQMVYSGAILRAWGDFQAAPNVGFNIVAATTGADAVRSADAAGNPVTPTSFNGSVDVATAMKGFAGKLGYSFENNGVATQLSNCYFPGTTLAQLQACARHSNINYVIDRGTLAIWPKGGSRGGNIPLVSPQTGMVGYPIFSSQSLIVRSSFLPTVKLGGQIKVQSSLPVACGIWTTWGISHELESQVDGGAWFTEMECYPNV